MAHVQDRAAGAGGWTTYDDEDVKEVRPSSVLGMGQVGPMTAVSSSNAFKTLFMTAMSSSNAFKPLFIGFSGIHA